MSGTMNSGSEKSPTTLDNGPDRRKDRPARRGRPPGSGGKKAPPAPASREAKRLAAAILEVLAGQRTPTEAAGALKISLPRYYVLEQRALEGLLVACEPRTKGPGQSAEKVIADSKRQIDRLERECARWQALVRATGRTVGLTAAVPAKAVRQEAGKNRKRRRRRPTARALKTAAALRADSESSSIQTDGSDVPCRIQRAC